MGFAAPTDHAANTGCLRLYEEENNIETTISYIDNAISNSPNISVIIVGTARERNAIGENPTLLTASRAISHLKNFLVVEAPVKPEELCGNLGDAARSGGVVYRRFEDLDAVFESDTCDNLRQVICAFQPPPGF